MYATVPGTDLPSSDRVEAVREQVMDDAFDVYVASINFGYPCALRTQEIHSLCSRTSLRALRMCLGRYVALFELEGLSDWRLRGLRCRNADSMFPVPDLMTMFLVL